MHSGTPSYPECPQVGSSRILQTPPNYRREGEEDLERCSLTDVFQTPGTTLGMKRFEVDVLLTFDASISVRLRLTVSLLSSSFLCWRRQIVSWQIGQTQRRGRGGGADERSTSQDKYLLSCSTDCPLPRLLLPRLVLYCAVTCRPTCRCSVIPAAPLIVTELQRPRSQ